MVNLKFSCYDLDSFSTIFRNSFVTIFFKQLSGEIINFRNDC